MCQKSTFISFTVFAYLDASLKPVTTHQWAVYDYIKTIPVGKVSTYKVRNGSECRLLLLKLVPQDVTLALGSGSPRSGKQHSSSRWACSQLYICTVGTALRNNPFAPYIPCHRVIASNYFVGGYCGEWGAESKTGTQYPRKLALLKEEGVEFNDRGVLIDKSCLL